MRAYVTLHVGSWRSDKTTHLGDLEAAVAPTAAREEVRRGR
jgi:hypothetical protein